jgi:hypothetical protein
MKDLKGVLALTVQMKERVRQFTEVLPEFEDQYDHSTCPECFSGVDIQGEWEPGDVCWRCGYEILEELSPQVILLANAFQKAYNVLQKIKEEDRAYLPSFASREPESVWRYGPQGAIARDLLKELDSLTLKKE